MIKDRGHFRLWSSLRCPQPLITGEPIPRRLWTVGSLDCGGRQWLIVVPARAATTGRTQLAARGCTRAHWADEFTPHPSRRHHRHRIGHGSAAVDRVTISLAVEAVRAEPGDAFADASDTATRLLAILADGGVDSRSVRTSDLTLGPRIEYDDGRQQVQGYQAGQRLTVLRDGLNGIERLLTDVASLGGDGVRIDGVSLTAGHPEEAMKLARDAAFADATAKAEQLAALAGRTLGSVQWIDERPDGGGPRPMMAMRAMAAEADAGRHRRHRGRCQRHRALGVRGLIGAAYCALRCRPGRVDMRPRRTPPGGPAAGRQSPATPTPPARCPSGAPRSAGPAGERSMSPHQRTMRGSPGRPDVTVDQHRAARHDHCG